MRVDWAALFGLYSLTMIDDIYHTCRTDRISDDLIVCSEFGMSFMEASGGNVRYSSTVVLSLLRKGEET